MLVAIAVSAAVGVATAGCATAQQSDTAVAADQQTQLDEYISPADLWGAEIMAQIPLDETATVYERLGGVRSTSSGSEEWPKYYFWSESVDLLLEDARTPTQLADDLEPWLGDEGWETVDNGFLFGDDFFRRSYSRGEYSLTVEVYTVPAPSAQTLVFSIVAPDTD